MLPEGIVDYKLCLTDVALLLVEDAWLAKREFEERRGTPEESFYEGQLLAYNKVISLLQAEAQAFGIPLSALHLEDLDPDRDL